MAAVTFQATVAVSASLQVSPSYRPVTGVPCQLATFSGLRVNSTSIATQSELFSGLALTAEPRQQYGLRSTLGPVRATVASPIPKQKIRIKLRSYWVPLLQQACTQILDAANSTGSGTMGPVPLPTHRRIYCVLRSPHVDKDSREHFQIKTHKRLIDLINPNAQTIDALMQLDLPAGVDVEVKLS